MAQPSAPCESDWIIAGRKRLRPLAPCLATDAVRASPPYITTPPRQSVFNELIAARHWRGPSQCILNVFPIRPHGCEAHHLGSSMCRERGFPTARYVMHPRSRSPLHAGQASCCRAAVEVLAAPCAFPGGGVRSNSPRICTALPITSVTVLPIQKSLKSAYSGDHEHRSD